MTMLCTVDAAARKALTFKDEGRHEVRGHPYRLRQKPSPSRAGLGGDGYGLAANTIPIPTFPLKGKEQHTRAACLSARSLLKGKEQSYMA
jgi:hypothetical protein